MLSLPPDWSPKYVVTVGHRGDVDDEIVPHGTDIGTLDQAYVPPALQRSDKRRRPASGRSAT